MHMQDDFPLNLSTLYDRSVWLYPDQEIVSVEADRSRVRRHLRRDRCGGSAVWPRP